jgi:hypothetical protein
MIANDWLHARPAAQGRKAAPVHPAEQSRRGYVNPADMQLRSNSTQENLKTEISFTGPFSWANVLLAREASASGIYLWTVATQRGNEIYYVGETGVSFRDRLQQHASDFFDAKHGIYAAAELTQGKRRLVWPGYWGIDKKTAVECRDQSKHLTSYIQEMMSVMRLFLAPLGTDTDTRRRIEAAIIDSLYDTPGSFMMKRVWHRKKRNTDVPFRYSITSPVPLVDMPGLLWV